VSTISDKQSSPPPRTFDEVFASIADVRGWMTEAQAKRLWDRGGALRPGDQVVEIGSFHGRSMIVLATAAPEGVRLVAIDPHGGNDRGPQEISGYAEEAQQDFQQFHANLRAAGVSSRVTHLRAFSSDALADVSGEIQLLYIDGAHRYRPALADIRAWGNRVADGGTMLVHDSFSSVGVTLALMSSTFFGRSFRYVGRSGSMTEYRRTRLTRAERVRNALRQAAELPWFVRNVVVKVCIVAKLRPVYRLLGSDGEWPY
jgi:predicted O-methyltransferase YrrM